MDRFTCELKSPGKREKEVKDQTTPKNPAVNITSGKCRHTAS